MKCPHCQKEFNAGKVMGSTRSEKKTAAAKERGKKLATQWANARKVDKEIFGGAVRKDVQESAPVDQLQRISPIQPVSNPAPAAIIRPEVGLVLPKGSMKLDELKAMLKSGGRIGAPAPLAPDLLERDLHDVPRAPFDFNHADSGEPHRVTQIGKKLGLFYLGGGEPVFTRNLQEGELERFWEARIK